MPPALHVVLFVSQGDHGINASGAPGREIGRRDRNERQQKRNHDKRKGIVRADAEEKALQQACESKSSY
jgi:hypothetical protein